MRLSRMVRFAAGLVLAGIVAGGATPVSALERGQIRLGSDYDIFQTGSDDYKDCERACEEDSRCKSWTFLTKLGQCRLKHSVAPKFDNNCCVSDVKRDKPADRRADEVLCSDFAVAALRDNNANLSNQCGYRGPQWSASFADTFNRCLDSSPARRARETKERAEALDDCRKLASRSQKVECDTIARLAVEQSETQRQAKCGFNTSAWHTDTARYVKACIAADRSERWDFLFRREKPLTTCLVRGGKADQECDDYAARSVNQFRRAQKMRCGRGFSGLFWHANAEDHYDWCRKASKSERAKWLKERQQQLSECEDERRKGLKFIFKF
ncbi:MAG: PAN domain-containing protein [Hyphomicrobiaceae bacterium]